METNIEIIESLQGKDSSVDVLRHKQLLGSNDSSTAQTLFFANAAGMNLKQVRITLQGTDVMIEAGLLHFMKGAITLESKVGGLSGLAKKMISSALTNEATFKPTYRGKGEIYLEPTFGHYLLVLLDKEEMITDKGMFVACEAGVEVGVAAQKNVSSALFGGEGFFQTRVSGTGWCVLSSTVPSSEIVRCTLNNEKLSVDGNFAMLRKGQIEFKVEKSSKSLMGSATGGEGLLQTFTGTGEVWLAPTQLIYQRMKYEGLGNLLQAKGSSGSNTR